MRVGSSLARLAQSAVLLLIASGCGVNKPGPGVGGGSAVGEGPFGRAADSRLLAPFAGVWIFDFDKTLEAFKAAGTSEEQLAPLRKLYAENSQIGKMHADVTITGNEIVGTDGSEYRLFGMHEHDGKVCGKAWHHEDRSDPGDMSKCYVRLKSEGNLLSLEMKMKEGLPDLNDPELLSSSLPAEGGSPATCDAESPADPDWSDWTTYVFSKK